LHPPPAPTTCHPLSLHDALPIFASIASEEVVMLIATASGWTVGDIRPLTRLNVTAIAEDGAKREIGSYGGGGRVTFDFFLEGGRSEEHTSELQSRSEIVCRLLLE